MKLFLSQDLAKRIELADAASTADYVDAQRILLPEVGVEHQPLAGATLLYAGPKSPVNRAIALGFTPVSEQQLIEAEEWFAAKQCAPLFELCPFVSKELIQLFAKRQYKLVSFKNVWALSLEDFSPQAAESPIDVRLIQESEQELWALTVGRGFASREDDVDFDVGIARPTSISKAAACSLAFVDNEAAGGAGMSISSDGLTFLFGMSTRVAFRQRGVQSALLQHRLKIAKERGYSTAIIHTAPTNTNSQRNVERLGFQLLYTKITLGA